MSKQQSSYRQIMKATSIFGGVQFFQIIISIIRSKFVAVLLGPAGMGIAGLLTTTIALISGITNFGLGKSAVKDIAAATASENGKRVSIVVTVIRRLVWITGLLGALITLVFSSWLSRITFGNDNYTYAFIWISITLLLNQISTGQGVILRGMRKVKYLAKASMIGSALGLLTTVPLYYFFGEKGIVPGIIVTSATSLILTWYYANKVRIKSIRVSGKSTISEGKGMLTLGFMISLSGLIALGASYIVRIFISNEGGVEDVGLYNAGFAIINSYVGMIFTAMSTDYYPRLAAVANNNELNKREINQQAEIALLILAPVIIVFLVFINWGIILLYSSKFISINNMILWAILGILFKAPSWAIAFIFLAKGDTKLFFWNELIFNSYLLLFNLIGYYHWGLTGLGISYLIGYIIYLSQVYLIARKKFQFSFNPMFIRIFFIHLGLSVSCLIVVKTLATPYSYFIGSVIIIISGIFSFNKLDQLLNLKPMLKSFWRKIK